MTREQWSLAALLVVALTTPAAAQGQGALERAEAQLRNAAPEGPQIVGNQAAAADSGYLGVRAFDRGSNDGVRLVSVVKGGPADKSGLQEGDIVKAVQNTLIRSTEEFAQILAPVPAGGTVTFAVVRGDEDLLIDVTLGRRPAAPTQPAPAGEPRSAPPRVIVEPSPAGPAAAPLGLRVQAMTDVARRAQALTTTDGVQVSKVTRGSAADKAGITVDSVIVAIDDLPIRSPDDAAAAIGTARAGEILRFVLFERGKQVERSVAVEPTGTPAAATPPGRLPPPAAPAPSNTAARLADDASKSSDRVHRLEQRVAELESQLELLQKAVDTFTRDFVPK